MTAPFQMGIQVQKNCGFFLVLRIDARSPVLDSSGYQSFSHFVFMVPDYSNHFENYLLWLLLFYEDATHGYFYLIFIEEAHFISLFRFFVSNRSWMYNSTASSSQYFPSPPQCRRISPCCLSRVSVPTTSASTSSGCSPKRYVNYYSGPKRCRGRRRCQRPFPFPPTMIPSNHSMQ